MVARKLSWALRLAVCSAFLHLLRLSAAEEIMELSNPYDGACVNEDPPGELISHKS